MCKQEEKEALDDLSMELELTDEDELIPCAQTVLDKRRTDSL